MRVHNVHERSYPVPIRDVGALIDSLASADDRLWPRGQWPAIRFDRPLSIGAVGGHGPVRYVVEAYEPGRSIRFRFTAPRGFVGTHAFEAEETAPGTTRLRHVLAMEAGGPARLSWPLVFRPLHDALVEDALDRAATSLALPTGSTPWSPWVRVLRAALRRLAPAPSRVA